MFLKEPWAFNFKEGEAHMYTLLFGYLMHQKLKKLNLTGSDLTFQKWFVSFVNENSCKSDPECCLTWVAKNVFPIDCLKLF